MIEFRKSTDGIYRISGTGSLRIGTIAKSVNRVDYSRDSASIRSDEKAFLAAVTGIDKKNIVMLNQVHGDGIVVIDRPPEKDLPCHAEADGMMTDIQSICLVIRTADCVPVIAFDARKKILGAVHSGWRGCRLAISGKLVREMKRLFSTDARDITAFLLPSVGPESYTVSEDVALHFKDDVTRKNSEIYLNLWRNIERSFLEEGVPAENIFNAGLCTLKNSSEFYSYRNGDAGRNVNFCYLSGTG